MLFKMSRFAPLVVTSILVAHTSIAVPPAPLANVQAIILPSEVLLRWDPSPGADYYRVYRGGPDKRWVPLTNHLHTPTFRDTDFTTLPSWYQIGAYNNTGEASFTEPFQVYGDPLNQDASYLPYGLSVRPVSDTSVTIGWTLLDYLGGDAMIEVGPSLTDLTNFACIPEFKRRHDFVITNLQPDSSYVYRITSFRSVGKAFTYWNRFTTRPHTEPPPQLVDVSFWNNPVVVTDTDLPVPFTLTAHSASGMPTTYHLLPSPNLRGQILGQAPDLTFVPSPGTSGRDVLDLIYTDGGTNHREVVLSPHRLPHH